MYVHYGIMHLDGDDNDDVVDDQIYSTGCTTGTPLLLLVVTVDPWSYAQISHPFYF